ncbi:631_t:CDS:1, partial [Dentiscutata heterogama]
MLSEDENKSIMDIENQTDNKENTTNNEVNDENTMNYKYVMDDDKRIIE